MLSVKVRMNTELPDWVGVPDKTPPEERFNPNGKPVADQVNGCTKKVLLAVKVTVG